MHATFGPVKRHHSSKINENPIIGAAVITFIYSTPHQDSLICLESSGSVNKSPFRPKRECSHTLKSHAPFVFSKSKKNKKAAKMSSEIFVVERLADKQPNTLLSFSSYFILISFSAQVFMKSHHYLFC